MGWVSWREVDLDKLSKEELLEDPSLAVDLAKYNFDFGEHELAQNLDVLNLKEGKVALCLGINSDKNGWGMTEAAQQLEVLGLKGGAIALSLIYFSGLSGWVKTVAAQNPKVRNLCSGEMGRKIDGINERTVNARVGRFDDIAGFFSIDKIDKLFKDVELDKWERDSILKGNRVMRNVLIELAIGKDIKKKSNENKNLGIGI